MLPTKMSSTVLAKRIPTVLGLVVLVVGLIVGTILFGQGTGVFSPRATPETTPKLVKITNITDRSFSVSFLTEVSTTAFIKYSTDPNRLSMQAGDDRDQLYGTVQDYPLHHVSAASLDANTTYYFVIGTDQGALYDDGGSPFEVKTAVAGGTPPDAKTIFGSVSNTQGGPATGSIVYAHLEGAGELSQLVQDSGSWAIPLSNARKPDGSGYAAITNSTALAIMVQSTPEAQTASLNTTVGAFEMGTALTLGQSGAMPQSTPTPPLTFSPTPTIDILAQPTPTVTAASGSGGLLGDLLGDVPVPTATPTEAIEVDLTASGDQIVTTDQPVIVGNAPAGVVVNIQVHSETNISQTVTANSQGQFQLDLAAVGAQLEPGTHSVEYSYTDPTTGQLVTNTQTFTVYDGTVQLAQAAISPTATPTTVAYGTDYPYGTSPTPTTAFGTSVSTTPSPTVSGTPSPTTTASGSATLTPTSAVSTRSGVPSTASGLPVSGSTGTTLVLLFGGAFFLVSGAWSFWIAREFDRVPKQPQS